MSSHPRRVGPCKLVTIFLQEGLLYEFVISVHPLLLGAGIPLFEPGAPRPGLRLASGMVQLRYTTEAGSKPGKRSRS